MIGRVWKHGARRGTRTWMRALGCLLGMGLLLHCGLAVAGGPNEEDYSKHPGFVDFAGLGTFGEDDAVVEVYLHDALINMVAQMAAFAEPELADMLSKLKLIRVQKFLLEEETADKVERKISEMAAKLEKKGWVRAVRVREEDENIYVFFKLADNKLQGITVMAVEDYETAAFVNIVGEIDPEQIGRLGRHFDIDELDTDLLDELEDREREKRRREKRR